MNGKKALIASLIVISTTVFAFKPVTYTYDDGVFKEQITVTQPPKKAVTLAQFMTENLLALGLADRMVGTAFLDNPILPSLKDDYEKVPVLPIGEGHSHSISKEAFLATGVDFVSGWRQSISEEGTGSLAELKKRNVTPFVSRGLTPNGSLDKVYADFILLGEIFSVPEKGKQIVANMKKEVAPTLVKTAKLKKIPTVLVYDSGESEAFVGGAGLVSDLIRLAGGNNVYKNLGQDWGTVSYEDIIQKNPEIVIVTEYYTGAHTADKIKFLQTHPGLKNIDAIKNGRIYIIGLADLSPGIRNATTINRLYEMFHGNAKPAVATTKLSNAGK